MKAPKLGDVVKSLTLVVSVSVEPGQPAAAVMGGVVAALSQAGFSGICVTGWSSKEHDLLTAERNEARAACHELWEKLKVLEGVKVAP